MIHHPQFMPNVQAAASVSSRQQQHQQQRDSSASSPKSASTASPPHQISRVSPASTALVMSSNNISGQPNSRQLTPNSNSSSAGCHSNNGTSSSTNSTGAQQPQLQAPNPVMRQFACHAKSMSAGVVVSVPGISNNLASVAGIQQNNMINHNIVNSQAAAMAAAVAAANGHQHPQSVGNSAGAHHRSSQHQAAADHHQPMGANSNQLSSQMGALPSSHHHHSRSSASAAQQQVVMGGTGHRSLHHHSYSQQSTQTVPPTYNHHHHHHQNSSSQARADPSSTHQIGSSATFLDAHQAAVGSSSIILSNMSNVHNRSASTHLSNVLLGNGRANSRHNHSTSHHASRTNFPAHVANSIWSIDENISKSHGKLTASGYLPHPYTLNPSMTDMSCDNVSNASRFIDGAPAPSYYLDHNGTSNLRTNSNTNGPLASSNSLKSPEFLPICDLIFNLISMIIYFCENTFNIIALLALYYHAPSKYWSLAGSAFVVASHCICQPLSFKWIYKAKLEDCMRKREAHEELEHEKNRERRYYNNMAANMQNYPCGSCSWLPEGATDVQIKFLLAIAFDVLVHFFCLGFLVRYIKLVIPVTDIARVKRDARDLCILRMIQAFVQSAPLLLLLTYTVGASNGPGSITNLCVISALLSLINVCWALASFTKYARRKYMHKFVLTWLGIVSQLLWRLGTVSSRVVALSIYAVYYNYWMLVTLVLHWLTMFVWLFKPGNLLRDEINMPRTKRFALTIGAAWIYCFCYVNFDEHNSRFKIGLYYLIVFVENSLLFTVCQTFSSQLTRFKTILLLVVYLGFAFGMLFMFLYYKYFHVTVLNNGLSCSQESIDSIADQLSPAVKKIAGFKPGTLRLKSEDSLAISQRYNNTIHTSSHPELTKNMKPPYLSNGTLQAPLSQSGVFSCQLNGDLKEKLPKAHARRMKP